MNGTLGDRLVWEDGDFQLSQCAFCRHKTSDATTCSAFPDGIPPTILDNAVSHAEPFEGDNGVRLEAVDIAPALFIEVTGLEWPEAARLDSDL